MQVIPILNLITCYRGSLHKIINATENDHFVAYTQIYGI